MTTDIQPATETRSAKKKKGKGGLWRYFLLPGIVPQARELGRGGFSFLAFLIAYIYQGVRILPSTHPYTKIENLGTFGLRQVITAAANNVTMDRKHLDQVIIFFAVLSGIFVLFLQVISFLLMILTGEAFAEDAAAATGMFSTPNPDTDIAFYMMREVFGIPGFFGELEGATAADTAAGIDGADGRTPFHVALQSLFIFYNFALLVVAVLVFVYYLIVVVVETAQTGTPFGQRFSKIYAPLRLVTAIGLLVPLSYGYNGAQYITLYAAKIGSGFATTGWLQFNDSLTGSNPSGEDNVSLISPSKSPDVSGLVEFMAVAVTCKESYKLFEDKDINGYVKTTLPNTDTEYYSALSNNPYDYLTAIKNQKDIRIVFGEKKIRETPAEEGEEDTPNVFIPYCGSVTIPISLPMGEVTPGQPGGPEEIAYNSGTPGFMQKVYFDFIEALWDNEELRKYGRNEAKEVHTKYRYSSLERPAIEDTSGQTAFIAAQKTIIEDKVVQHYTDAAESANFELDEATRSRGWGGAGIWYNRIAQINGAYVTGVMAVPAVSSFPVVMENVRTQKQQSDASSPACEIFEPNIADNKRIDLVRTNDDNYARTLNNAHQFWTCDNESSENFFLDAAAAIFGLEGLISIRDSVEVESARLDADGNTLFDEFGDPDTETTVYQIHPLAKLSALGRGLVESAVRNMMMAVGTSIGGGLLASLPQAGAGLQALSSMFVSLAVIGLSIGFITFYILPFLPFIYFFFAVGGWVKGIFEAMVGAPLWALAHLRIDGDGIPGKMALNGYFLIFEIFLRPILTVMGLIGGMAIFSALAAMLNEVFDLVVCNTSGGVNLLDDSADEGLTSCQGQERSTIDIFFFTVMYAIILYMMAMASFKMITLVPNSILRWLGQSVSAFNDNAGDPAANLTSYAAIGGNQIGQQLAGGMTQLGRAVGTAGSGAFGLASGGGKAQQGGNN